MPTMRMMSPLSPTIVSASRACVPSASRRSREAADVVVEADLGAGAAEDQVVADVAGAVRDGAPVVGS